jgi:RNase P subunit RPR2
MNEQTFLYKAAHLLAPESPLVAQSLLQRFAKYNSVKLNTYCENCFKVYIPSINCKVALNKKKLVIHCYACNKIHRSPLSFATKQVQITEPQNNSKSKINKKNKKRKDLTNLLQNDKHEEKELSLFDFLGQL